MQQKNKVKAVLLLASSMTVMAGATISPALTDMADYFGDASDMLIKLIITMPALVIALVGTAMGILSDKIGRKNLLAISLGIYGIGGFAGFFIDDIYWLLASRAVLGIGVAGIASIATTLIGDYFRGEERSSFTGMQAAFMSLGGVFFLLAGGALADISWRYPFLIYLFSFVVLPLTLLYLYEPEKVRSKDTTSNNVNPFSTTVILIYSIGFIGMIFFYMIPTQIPFLLKEKVDVSNMLIGLAIAVTTTTGAITSLRFNHLKKIWSHQTLFGVNFLLMAIGFFLTGFFDTYIGVLFGLGITGLGVGLMMPNCNLWLMEIAPTNQRGKIIGTMSSVFFLGQFLSPIVVAAFLKSFNLVMAFYGSAAIMLILGVGLFFTGNGVQKN